MRQMMRQMETLLPSCGVAESIVAPEQVILVTCTQVVVDKTMPVAGELVTATATLFKRGLLIALEPLVGKSLNYRVMKGIDILSSGSAVTDSNGQITFSFVVNEVGIFRFLASFFGENPELPDTPQRWLGCREVNCTAVGEPPVGPGDGSDLPDLPDLPDIGDGHLCEPWPQCCFDPVPPGIVTPCGPWPECCLGIGGGVLPQPLKQHGFCGIGCGQNMNQNLNGLEPE